MTLKVGFKTEATGKTGFGHLKRLLNLLNGWSSVSPLFFSREPLPIIPYETVVVKSAEEFRNQIVNLDLLIIDEPQILESFINIIPKDIKLVGFDELGQLRDKLEIHFVTTLLGLDNKIEQRGKTKEYIGRDYFIFPEIQKPSSAVENRSILVTFGGSDPAGLSVQYSKNLDCRILQKTVMILGPGFDHQDIAELKLNKDLHLVESPASLVPYYLAYPVTITGGGISAYEAIRFGSRALLCSQHSEQYGTANRLADRDLAMEFGVHPNVNWSKLNAILTKYTSEERKIQTSRDRSSFFDGLGTQRVRTILEEYAQS